MLDAAAEQELDTLLDNLEKDTTSEIAVVTLESLDQIPVEEYANTLFNDWRIGQRGNDNGVLVLVGPTVREMRIEVGYGLEGVLPDGLAGSVIREQFVPAFREGDYQSGIVSGVRRIAEIVRRNEPASSAPQGPIRLPAQVFGIPTQNLSIGAMMIPFTAVSVFICLLGIGRKIVLLVLIGAAFAAFPPIMVRGHLPAITIFHGVLAAVVFLVGFVFIKRSRSDRFDRSNRGWVIGLGGGSSGWRASAGSTGSSTRSSSGGFGGGRSGGGGASGRW